MTLPELGGFLAEVSPPHGGGAPMMAGKEMPAEQLREPHGGHSVPRSSFPEPGNGSPSGL